MVDKKGISYISNKWYLINWLFITVALILLLNPTSILGNSENMIEENTKEEIINSDFLLPDWDSNPFNLSHFRIFFDESQMPKYYTDTNNLGDGFGYNHFAGNLEAVGHFVGSITTEYSLSDLLNMDLLIIIEPFSGYSSTQLDSIEDWYTNYGGNLLLLRDHKNSRPIDQIASRFGFSFSSEYIYETDDYLYNDHHYNVYSGANIQSHNISTNVNQVEFEGGPGIVSYPVGTEKIIITDNDVTSSYYDPFVGGIPIPTNGDPVMCAWKGSTPESGRMIVVSETDFWSSGEEGSGPAHAYLTADHSTLAKNTINWLLESWSGLLDITEHQIGTSLASNDTDSDNLTDYDEYVIYNTNPLRRDTDYDGLNDFDELFVYFTNPRNDDSDYDDIPDGYEIDVGLNPLNQTDGGADFDNDLLTNYLEYIHSTDLFDNDTDDDFLCDGQEVLGIYYPTSPFANGTGYIFTDPLISDTDSDNITDGIEYNIYGTDPLMNDTDQDMLLDEEEIFVYFTDPTKWDTDSDSYSDGLEVQSGTDPLDPKSFPGASDFWLTPWKWSVTGASVLIFISLIPVVVIFTRKRIKIRTESLLRPYSCRKCGSSFGKDDNSCRNCNAEIDKCIVCKLPISEGEEISKCSYCEAIGHHNHFVDWIENSSKCPRCQRKLDFDDLVSVE